MDATVIFKIGDIEIKTTAGVPQFSWIQGEVRDSMTINNALTKLNKIGLDLSKIDENIKEKAKVY